MRHKTARAASLAAGFALALLAALAAGAAAAADNAAPRLGVTVEYDFYYGEIKVADSVEELTFFNDGKEYEIKRTDTAVGLAKLLHGDSIAVSRGVVDNERGLLATLYWSKRGGRERQEAKLTTPGVWGEWDFYKGDLKRQEKVLQPVFDYLTAAYRSYIVGKPTGGTLWMTNGWRLRQYGFEVKEGQTAQTGMGELPAVALLRQSGRGSRTMWLAKKFNWLPARLRIDDKGHVFVLVAKSVKINRAGES